MSIPKVSFKLRVSHEEPPCRVAFQFTSPAIVASEDDAAIPTTPQSGLRPEGHKGKHLGTSFPSFSKISFKPPELVPIINLLLQLPPRRE